MVVTVNLASLLGQQGQGWQLLTAGAFVSMAIPLLVFVSLQRYFIRGMTSGADAAARILAISPPIPHAAPDEPVRRHLLPMPVDGWRLRPGLRGARADGTAWSPLFTLRSVESDFDDTADRGGGGWVTVNASDEQACLRLQTRLTLHPSGVLEIEQSLRNVGPEDYLLAELAATLPVPARALEVLDLTGRWCREHIPQRQHLNLGAWVREGRRGRTDHDSALVLTAGTEGFGFGAGEVW